MVQKILLSPDLCRAARGLLDWTQNDLNAASGVATKTIADYERGARTPYDRTLRDLFEAFETAGIEFTNGDAPGLRLKPSRRSRK
jgi:transcriptional regulator with XRE-family HTH domain